MNQISKFSLYGFLKNLRFYEPFFILFLRDKGLSYLDIGILFSIREIAINLMEVPSGAIADLYGRRSTMLFSLGSYILSFIAFGLASKMVVLYIAMFLFAIGEAFRTGTHKAMIFHYLREKNMLKDKTRIYGFTRSWSQKGSAVSVLIGGALVFWSGNYAYIFWFSLIPYILGFWNMASYPQWLNCKTETGFELLKTVTHLRKALKTCIKNADIRSLLIQSTIYTGKFKTVKDYLQPVIQLQVSILPVLLYLNEKKRIAILIAVVYFVLYYLNSIVSKNAFRLVKRAGNEKRSSLYIFSVLLMVQLISCLGAYLGLYYITIIGFIFIYLLHNIWRPILIGQFDDCVVSKQQATIMSVESQASSLGVFILAPIMGYAADTLGIYAVFGVSSMISGLFLGSIVVLKKLK